MIITNSINNAGVYLVLLEFYLYFTVINSSIISKLLRRKIDSCTNLEFQCKNGQCIATPFICDGITDCQDGSDETHNQCKNKSCDNHHFQCNYGACINKEYQCDGLKQCLDGSDEWEEACNRNITIKKSVKSKRTLDDLCAVPAQSPDKVITYNCEGTGSTFCDTKNGYVPEFAVATVNCMPNYLLERESSSDSICHRKTWVPPIDNCLKICDKLTPINVDLRCSRNGISISCDETPLLAGTKVRPSCQKLHRYVGNIPPNYLEMTCDENGKWDESLFSCVPECGRPYTNPTTLISGGVPEVFGDSPWHVAVYNAEKVLICGGTIINPYLVLSAAHCFGIRGSSPPNASNYEIAVSKVTRDYSKIDNENQKIIKIKEIRFSDKGYFGLNNYFAADIAILILNEKLQISSTVLPACVDWIALSTRKHPEEGILAKVSGWGTNARGRLSEKLMTVRLPYIRREHCLSIVPNDFKAFITFDKFCAGSEGGPGVLQGDSGGGLLFPQQSQEGLFYYLRGIVSLKQPTSTTIAAFTDLADHIEWILSVARDIERNVTASLKRISVNYEEQICENQDNRNCIKIQDCQIADTLIASKTAVFCGHDSNGAEKICCSLPNSSSTFLPSVDSSQIFPIITTQKNEATSTKNSTEIALFYCEKYSKYATECVLDDPPIGERKKALLKEYPHIARIGCGSDLNNVVWCCVGSLISEMFILSAGLCGTEIKEDPSWAFLGHLNEATVKLTAQDKIYSIEKIYKHPEYFLGEKKGFAIFKLKEPVVINSFIRPACLFTSNMPQIHKRFRIAGWGNKKIYGARSSNLLKSTISVVDDEQCEKICTCYKRDSRSCVGNYSDGEALCLAARGAPLQTVVGNDSCVWSIFSMISFSNEFPASCGYLGNAKPYISTKVSHYLDWIQTIVWP